MENYCGKRLDGRYEIREIIGVGGMAVVYKAYDNIDDRIVAVKILKEELLENEEFRRRFKNESKAIAVLSHPNIVKVYDVSFGDRLQYIVMEYIEGITLKEYIEQQMIINWKETVHFVSQILLALQHAHDKGIVHRDIKPQNIMLLQDGTIKVTDFGIARFSRSDTRTMSEEAIGSVHYISPEQARGEITDDKADIYSVGVMMYEMLTGQLPFQSDNAVSIAIMQLQQEAKPPREINPNIPLGLEQITMRAMQKKRSNRYHSAAEMLLDIDEFKRNPSIKFNYNYFVDNEPTKYVPRNNAANAAEQPPVRNERRASAAEKENAAEKEEPSKTMPILFGVVAGIIVIIAVFAGILIFRGTNKIAVPDFVGMNYNDEILTNSEYTDKFKFETESVYSEDKDAGVVISQTPEKNTNVKKGSTVKLSIAYNDENVLITGVLGLTQKEAETKLSKQGFSVKVVEQYEKNLSPGLVINTEPAEGAFAVKGSTVTVYVSTDKNPNQVTVPEVQGQSKELAIELLKSAGFTVSAVDQDNEAEKGQVINQKPTAGTKADSGSEVTIYVSTGVPAERTASIDVSLPKTVNQSTGTMKVYLGSDLYKTYDEVLLDGGTKTIQITGKGADQKFTVKINDQTVLRGTIDFTKDKAEVSNTEKNVYVEKSPIPDVVGKDVSEAMDILEKAGFTNVDVYDSENNPVSSGTVTSQLPVYDSSTYTPSQKITLTVE